MWCMCCGVFSAFSALMIACGGAAGFQAVGLTPPDRTLSELVDDAEAVRPAIMSEAGGLFLNAASALPAPPTGTVWYQRTREESRAFTQLAFNALSDAEKKGLRSMPVQGSTFYTTRYGTPIVYARAIDVVAQAAGPDFTLAGKRVLDLGYGQFGQLRMMAICGAVAIGVDVDPVLRAMGELPGAQGVSVGEQAAVNGLVKAVDGQWPGGDFARTLVGDDLDIIIARNVLKRGYVRPVEETEDWSKVDLGMPAEDVPGAMRAAMKPGGYVLIYNIGTKPAAEGEAYDPRTDIADPWTAEEWEKAGFAVLLHDQDESRAARIVACLLGWGEAPYNMDLERDLFGNYTLLRAGE